MWVRSVAKWPVLDVTNCRSLRCFTGQEQNEMRMCFLRAPECQDFQERMPRPESCGVPGNQRQGAFCAANAGLTPGQELWRRGPRRAVGGAVRAGSEDTLCPRLGTLSQGDSGFPASPALPLVGGAWRLQHRPWQPVHGPSLLGACRNVAQPLFLSANCSLLSFS